MIALTPFKKWFLCRVTDINPDTKSQFYQILRDPITRLYLHKHMKDLLQEEKYYYI